MKPLKYFQFVKMTISFDTGLDMARYDSLPVIVNFKNNDIRYMPFIIHIYVFTMKGQPGVHYLVSGRAGG